MGGFRKRFAIGLLACCLPLAAAWATEPAPATAAAPDAATTAEAPAAEEPAPAPDLEAYAGVVQKVMSEGLLVRRAGQSTDPGAGVFMIFTGRVGVPVEGEGKSSWLALRRGDLVLVSYEKGPPHRAKRVNVLPKPVPPPLAAARGEANKPRTRSFVGYVKKKDGDELIVMSPAPPPPAKRPAEVKAFVRKEHTTVDVLRDSWDAVRKGDRVKIDFQKGNPRPIDRVQVIRRGGEEPLPPGVATRLFDPRFDSSVKDVDGIGETTPVPPRPRRVRSPNRIKLPKHEGR